MKSLNTLRGFLSRYCREYRLPFPEHLRLESSPTLVLPIRVGELLFSFQLGIRAEEEREIFSIRVPVMEVPIRRALLPLYRRLLELNDTLPGVRFSIDSSHVYLAFIHGVGENLYGGKLTYQGFKTIMNRFFSALSRHAAALALEFSDRERRAGAVV